jgi:nicotinate-nucleotide adenylyltransferase
MVAYGDAEHHDVMKRVCIFGGAFDPPHIGHLGIISTLLNTGAADEVWLVPTGDRGDKSIRVEAAHRKAMLELFLSENFAGDSAVRLELCQLNQSLAGSYTVDLMAHLRHSHPQDEFRFVIGSDLLKDLPLWKETERLKQEVTFLVIPRPGSVFPTSCDYRIETLTPDQVTLSGVSSTLVRQLLRDKKRTAGLLTPAVLSYIKSKQLYNVSTT